MISKLPASFGVFLLLGGVVGCSGGSGTTEPRYGVEGTVLADDQPLDHGSIAFIPQGETKGPRAVARIIDGEFHLDRAQGPCAGQFRVEVSATSPDVRAMQESRRVQDISPEAWKSFRDVQAEFNMNSTLTATVTADGPNDFEFKVRRIAK